jgi:hypothetical protein
LGGRLWLLSPTRSLHRREPGETVLRFPLSVGLAIVSSRLACRTNSRQPRHQVSVCYCKSCKIYWDFCGGLCFYHS